ncbi:hypothetical protein [Rubinisphaera italica]|uniref:Uncharacterized protein n=1 Tax=Rubinisphaera italica TaxID=2527969 RepID=A0A5C5XL02_9PLAN|nr:hypothetical protein [Rubinisphaera italica]TWT63388.1 hypothetical protein Pan54_41410 [Rubinisphaera italica]
MAQEKKRFEKFSIEIRSIGSAIDATGESLSEIHNSISVDAISSLKLTDQHLDMAGNSLSALQNNSIPAVKNDIKQQQAGLRRTIGVFSSVSQLLDLMIISILLTTIAIAFSGFSKVQYASKPR